MAVRLEWEGKPTQVERLALPFQTVETINESRATRERDAGALFDAGAGADGRAQPADLGRQQARDEQPAGGVRGQGRARLHRSAVRHRRRTSRSASRSATTSVDKQPSDPRGARVPGHLGSRAGTSYLSMMYERLVLIHELLADDGIASTCTARRM